MVKINKRFQIKTSEGYRNFSGVQFVNKNERITITLTNGLELSCSNSHLLFTKKGWNKTEDITLSDDILTENGFCSIQNIVKIDNHTSGFYDILGVENEEYITNGIISHNCEFLGSDNTLISSAKISAMPFMTPIHTTNEGVRIYEAPRPGRVYTMCVDTSRGEGIDYHAFTVTDTTEVPYKVVAAFRHNKISPQLYPAIIAKVATQYNEAYVLVELNDLGQLVGELLHGELEYGNLIIVTHRGKRGQSADGGFGGGGVASKNQCGVKMSYQVKGVGCSALKDMIELDKLLIPDFDIISEMSTFVKKGAGYEATEGYFDDMIMTLVMLGWLTTQSYFKDYTNTDLREKLFAEKMRQIEEGVLPFGFIDNGVDDFEADDGLDLNAEKMTPREKKHKEYKLWDDLEI